MKLVDLSKKAVTILKEAGEKGINNIEPAEKLQMPRRRVYDIIAILRATELVESKREKGGTRIFWKTIPSIELSTAPVNDTKALEKQKAEVSKLEKENNELKGKIKRLRADLSKGGTKKTSEKQFFEVPEVAIRAAKALKITEVTQSVIEVIIKVNGNGIVVEPISKDKN